MTNALSAAQLAIYALLAPPALYIVIRHGKRGILGWLGVFMFCIIRLIAGATSLEHDGPPSSIVSNIGLSALLLAVLGVLHEGRTYRGLMNAKLEWILVIGFHVHVIAAVALMISGLAAPSPDLPLVVAGIALLVVAWLAFCVWTGVAFWPGQHDPHSPTHPEGTMMLKAVACALVFVGVRIFYTLVALVTQAAYLDPISGALAVRVVLAFLPELSTLLVLLAAGWQTRGVKRLATKHEGSGEL